MASNGPRILVTGGAGFIGSHTVDMLLERGYSPVVIDNLSTGRASNVQPGVPLFHADILDPQALWAAVEGCEGIIHLAAVVSVPRSVESPSTTHQVNLTGTLNVLEAARSAGIKRVVMASSAAVYGDAEPPLLENLKPRPLSPYALEKLGCELYGKLYSRLYGLEAVSLRFFNVYGPRQDPASPYSGVLSKFADVLSARRQGEIHGDGQQTRDFVFVRDVSAAVIQAWEQAEDLAGSVFNVGTGTPTTVEQAYREICRILGGGPGPKFGPARVGDVRHSLADISRTRLKLGWEPRVSFAEGIQATLASLRKLEAA